jgi:ribosomal protein L9
LAAPFNQSPPQGRGRTHDRLPIQEALTRETTKICKSAAASLRSNLPDLLDPGFKWFDKRPKWLIIQQRGIKKSPTYVILSEAIDGLGRSGDVVAVDRGLARGELIPNRKATYVPRDRLGRPIFPDSFVEKAQKWSEHSQDVVLGGKLSDTVILDLLNQLKSLPEIKMARPPSGTEDHFFGSVTTHDLARLLEHQYNVMLDPHMIHVGKEDKIKTFGKHIIHVKLPDTADIPVQLHIHPDQPAS